jgi:hypothetical protein
MPETKQKSFAESLLRNTVRGDAGDDTERTFTAERQLTAQAFNLHVEYRDGRRSEGFAWSHYGGNQWSDDGSHETLVVMFGARAVEIEGHNLGVLVSKIREGQLNGIRELSGAQALSLQESNPDNQPIITAVRSYPDFAELLKELKGGDDEHEAGHAGRVRGR